MPSSTDDNFEINNVWGQNQTALETFPHTLPSGQRIRYRRLGIEQLIEAGFLEQIEVFSSMLEEGPIAKGKAKLQGHKPSKKAQAKAEEKAALKLMTENPDMFPKLITMIDRLLPLIVAQPTVRLHYVKVGDQQAMLAPEDREPGAVYADQIDFMDKMELFTLGVGNLGEVVETFRGFSGPDVGAVASESGVPHDAQ